MKKVVTAIALLLCIVITFSSCSVSLLPENIDKIISNVSGSVQAVEPLDNDYNGRVNYYYLSLDDKGKENYTKIYNAYMNFSGFTVDVLREEIDYMLNCVLYDNPEIFWVASSYSISNAMNGYYIGPDYRFSAGETADIKSEVDSALARITALAGSESSDYGKEKFFHDYICKNTKYDMSTYGDLGDTAYSVFSNGKAICEGYARAMKMLLDVCGIYNYIVTGNTKNDEGKIEGHMWNVVSIGGDLYHVDVTWDDAEGEIGEVSYLYFNVTDDDIRKNHFDIIPQSNNCTSIKYNYFLLNGLYFSYFNNFNGMAPVCAAGITEDLIVEMRFQNNSDYEAVKQKAINNETDRAFYDFTLDVVRYSGKKITSQSYAYDDDLNYLCVVFEKG